MDYEVIILRQLEDFNRWNNFVRKSPQANPFAVSEWLEVVAKELDADFDILVARKGEEWLAGVPVLYKTQLSKKVCLLAPLSAYNSFVYSPFISSSLYPNKVTSYHLDLSGFLAKYVMGNYAGVIHLLLPTIDDIRPWKWLGWHAIPRYTYEIDLNQEFKIAHSVRKHICKCEKIGYNVSWSWNIDCFWDMYQHTQERQSFRIERDFFVILANSLHDAGMAQMATANSPQGDPAASRIQLSCPGTSHVFDWVAAGDPRLFSQGANSWLMIEVATKLRKQGYKIWDLCGADFEHIAKFKSSFGGQLIHYFQVQLPQIKLDQDINLMLRVRAKLKKCFRRCASR